MEMDFGDGPSPAVERIIELEDAIGELEVDCEVLAAENVALKKMNVELRKELEHLRST
jgi:regulator of replication initiation timing